jgi:hypothetical protein
VRRASAIVRRFHPSLAYITEKLSWARSHLRIQAALTKKKKKGSAVPTNELPTDRAVMSLIERMDIGETSGATTTDPDDPREKELQLQRAEAKTYQLRLESEQADAPDDDDIDPEATASLSAAALQSAAQAVEHRSGVEFRDLSVKDKLNLCLPKTILSIKWDVAADGAIKFYLAVTLPLGPKTGKKSVRIHWLDEIEPNIFVLSETKPWHKYAPKRSDITRTHATAYCTVHSCYRPEDIGAHRILDTPHVEKLDDVDGKPRWQLLEVTAAKTVAGSATAKQPAKAASKKPAASAVKPTKDALVADSTLDDAEDEPALHGAAGSIRSADCLISDDPIEWLNPNQMRNAAALMIDDVEIIYQTASVTGEQVPSGLQVSVDTGAARVLHIVEPFSAEGDGSNVTQILQSSVARRILDGTLPSDAIASNFVEERHWRFVALVAPEKHFYYWNPYGAPLGDDHPLRAALRQHVGWSLVCISTCFQSDGWNCGPWSHDTLEQFVSYFKTGSFDGFDKFLTARSELRALEKLRGKGLRTASAINKAYVSHVRDEMRMALRAAHTRGDMPFLPLENAPQFFVGEAEILQLQGFGEDQESGINLDE